MSEPKHSFGEFASAMHSFGENPDDLSIDDAINLLIPKHKTFMTAGDVLMGEVGNWDDPSDDNFDGKDAYSLTRPQVATLLIAMHIAHCVVVRVCTDERVSDSDIERARGETLKKLHGLVEEADAAAAEKLDREINRGKES